MKQKTKIKTANTIKEPDNKIACCPALILFILAYLFQTAFQTGALS
jgi:hypothetical protein